ncbi:hypothetical protein H04402_00609 [Clostridium botulinum H04402 065]|uniref:hypothetical protein n=1 Tax=Clostridium botulinum TaxID=1491 RepID=UPI0001F84ECF|nr:hypothetical protein [Clostridium botulinum]CBZ02420.1 hypothetical protein H04402_00609 [Clostridium botulinum H04402 065]
MIALYFSIFAAFLCAFITISKNNNMIALYLSIFAAFLCAFIAISKNNNKKK